MRQIEILLLENEKRPAPGAYAVLVREGYCVRRARTAEEALTLFRQEDASLVLLAGWGAQGEDDLLIREVRRVGQAPIVRLCAKQEELAHIWENPEETDDFVIWPVKAADFIMRIRFQMWRATGRLPGTAGEEEELIRVHGLELDRINHTVKVEGKPVRLTPIEFQILYLLASNAGRTFSTDEIFEKVWKERPFEVANTVMVHIRRLRRKIGEDSRPDKIITTVWGVGYKIEKNEPCLSIGA